MQCFIPTLAPVNGAASVFVFCWAQGFFSLASKSSLALSPVDVAEVDNQVRKVLGPSQKRSAAGHKYELISILLLVAEGRASFPPSRSRTCKL